MKKRFFLFVFPLLLAGATFAQDEVRPPQKPASPEWVSEKGYWVIEGNVHSPKSNTVYFYKTDNALVYKEKIEGMKIKVGKAKVCLRLKNALEQAIAIWEATHEPEENGTLVAVALKK